jgi:hypothetical protein
VSGPWIVRVRNPWGESPGWFAAHACRTIGGARALALAILDWSPHLVTSVGPSPETP